MAIPMEKAADCANKRTCRQTIFVAMLLITAILQLLQGIAWGDNPADEAHATITDRAGREIPIQRPYTRIISLYGAHTENLFALGLGDRLIGVSRHESYPPKALDRPVFSYHDDPEKFLAARPDLVLIRPMIDRGYAKLVQRLEKSGITVVSLQPVSIDEMKAYWRVLGALGGKPQAAGELIRRFEGAETELTALAQGIENPKRVYFEAIHTKMKTFTPQSMAIFCLERAGGINVADDAAQVRRTNIAVFGKERILARAQEIDVYLAQQGAMNRPTLAMIKEEAGFGVIKAVKNNEIYFVDEMIVSRPTTRLLLGIAAIGNTLYPARFGDRAMEILMASGLFRDMQAPTD